jgi:methylated-DNA-[protein]-cysteine S-methyltransferase
MTVTAELDARFRDAAAQAGLVDVAYDIVETPIGNLLVGMSDGGVCRISFDPEPEHEVEILAKSYGVRVLRAPRPVDPARRELDEYFAGHRRDFQLRTDLRLVADFNRRVLAELRRVPYGQVTTYGELAARASAPRAARAVGVVMHRNPIPIVLPCHRVIGKNGKLTGYGGGLDRKEALLRLEGALL